MHSMLPAQPPSLNHKSTDEGKFHKRRAPVPCDCSHGLTPGMLAGDGFGQIETSAFFRAPHVQSAIPQRWCAPALALNTFEPRQLLVTRRLAFPNPDPPAISQPAQL